MVGRISNPDDPEPVIEYWCVECRYWTTDSPYAHICVKMVRGEWKTWTDDAVNRDFFSVLAAAVRAGALRSGAGC